MCGLYASVGLRPDPSALDRIAHRGPDGVGWTVLDSAAGPVALGHRRLAIIDTDTRADQPMRSADGRFWLILNGEIYNYRELREELTGLGTTFRTQSDTEVLLEGWARWGARVLDRCVGMFALLVWDAREQVLHAARDRFGIKPLFFHASSQGVAFASEIKALLGAPGVERRLNLARAHNFLESGITDHTAESLFDGVRQLRPGERLELDLARWRPGAAIEPIRWWSEPVEDLSGISAGEAAERFRSLMWESVRLHLIADVPVGSCLSGGLDSSAIVGVMSRLLGHDGGGPVHTFSATFEEKEANEKAFMIDVVERTHAAPTYISPKPSDLIDDLQRLVTHQDEPFGSTSIFAQWKVFEAAGAAGVKVMLDGQGADEQLAGYHGAFVYQLRHLIRARRWGGLARTLSERKRWNGIGYRAQLAPFLQHRLPHRLAGLMGVPTAPPLEPWLSGPAAIRHQPVEGSTFAQALAANDLGAVDDIGDLCRAMTTVTNLPMLLRYEDRNSMAHSVEARVPFLDHRLVAFCLSLGASHKIVGGETKSVLRRGMGDVLPPSVLHRRDKLGFATPEERWFKGPLRAFGLGAVEDTLSLYPELFNADATRRHARQMLDGERPFDFSLWRIANLGLWGRAFGVS